MKNPIFGGGSCYTGLSSWPASCINRTKGGGFIVVRTWCRQMIKGAICALVLTIPPTLVQAGEAGPIILRLISTVDAGGGKKVELTMDQLLQVSQHEIVTGNDFIDGKRVFAGPLVRDVLALMPMDGAQQARLVARNDYFVDVDIEEFVKWDVILALTIDGEELSAREFGPIWVMYPIDDDPVLEDPLYNNRLIWQLVEVQFR